MGYFTTFLPLPSFPPCFVRSQLLPGMAFLQFLSLYIFPGPNSDPYILTPLYFIVASWSLFQSIPRTRFSLEYHIDRVTFIRFRVIAVSRFICAQCTIPLPSPGNGKLHLSPSAVASAFTRGWDVDQSISECQSALLYVVGWTLLLVVRNSQQKSWCITN